MFTDSGDAWKLLPVLMALTIFNYCKLEADSDEQQHHERRQRLQTCSS
jgi:hypothetical protein